MTEQDSRIYGCDPNGIMQQLVKPIADRGLGKVLASMLSDTQEMIACGQAELARKALNRVKYIIDQQMPSMTAAPSDFAVLAQIGRMRTLHSLTTAGTWHALPGRSRAISGKVSADGFEGIDVLRGQGRLPQEGKRNVEFSACMHNAAPAFLDAVELVELVLTEQRKLPKEQRNGYIVNKAEVTLATLVQNLS